MSCYRLTSGAESDTEQILRYTLRKWGAKQAARYAAQLETCLNQSDAAWEKTAIFEKTELNFPVNREPRIFPPLNSAAISSSKAMSWVGVMDDYQRQLTG